MTYQREASEPPAINRAAECIFDSAGNQLYGLDAELELKRREKRDPEWETKALKWVAEVTGEEIDVNDIWESLKSGVVLCKYVSSR